MQNIIEKFDENFNRNPQNAVFYDDFAAKGITNQNMQILSQKVYAYLKKNNIGRADFVLINLTRGIMPVVAILGVWRAGAAFALVEDNYAPERIEYIKKDCGCKITIDKTSWNEIIESEPLEGFETPGMHDAAYAIYTSGTTGNPKGVLHEYGNLFEMVYSANYQGELFITPEDKFALLAPMNFVASLIVIVNLLYRGSTKLYIASYSTIKNPLLLQKFFLEKRISITFLTPSYVRMLRGQTGPFLKTLIVGSEPANNVYVKGIDIYNFYAMSESGFIAGIYKIEKPCEPCPIGKPQFDLEIKLIKEDGEIAKPGETGEVIYKNEFTRGYMNLPEETKKAFVNGYYHTGDLARLDEDGNLILLGRSNDMIKINGNRIEPAEIEATVKSVLGIDWAAAKGFVSDTQAYLCVYYTADVVIDKEYLRSELLKRLPYYMIPSCYVKIDQVPLKANGKLDRKALPEPEHSDSEISYAAPTNDVEKSLCRAFAKVLRLERVGINDDFYEMGGDSLGAIEAIIESELPGLEASTIFRGRTAANIAMIYAESHVNDGETDDFKNAQSMKLPHRFTTEQLYMFDYQLYTPKSTMYNLFTMLKFDKTEIESGKLAKAVRMAVHNHPVLLSEFSLDEDGELIQRYNPDFLQEIEVEKITEKEFLAPKDTLVEPFKMVKSRMFRCRIFETENAIYLFFDVHHTVFDGTSFKVFMGSVAKAYLGMPMDKDYYYLMLKKREEAASTPFYEESRKYFEEKYNGNDWATYPETDQETRENEFGQIVSSLSLNTTELDKIEKKYKISRNELFITVSLLALHINTNKPNIKISWIYNGREDMEMMTTAGLLFRDLPVAYKFNEDVNVRDIYASVHEQVGLGIEHCCYPYVENNAQVIEGDTACLLYQRDLRDADGVDGMNVQTVDIRQNKAASQGVLDIEILDGAKGLEISLDYASSRYNNSTMENFKNLFMKVATVLVKCNEKEYITVRNLKDEVKRNNE